MCTRTWETSRNSAKCAEIQRVFRQVDEASVPLQMIDLEQKLEAKVEDQRKYPILKFDRFLGHSKK
jgi:hypothetical protein